MSEQPKPSNTVITIPQFMSEKEDAGMQENDIRQNAGRLYKLMLAISSIWFLVVVIYITQFFGWSNLFLMMPDEFGGFLAGITLPLAVIWMVIAYVDRGASFKQEAKLLHTYMNQLVYPEDGAAQTTKAMADAIREQVIELQQATKQATTETKKIKNELSQHITDFSKLIEVLKGYSGTTMGELNDGVRLMSQGLDYINDKVSAVTSDLEDRMTRFSATADTIKSDMTTVTSSLSSQLEHIKENTSELNNLYNGNHQIISLNNEMVTNCSKKLKDSFETINQFTSTQNERLEKISEQISRNYRDIYAQLRDKSVSVEESFAGQVKQISDYMKSLDKTSLWASEKFNDFRGQLYKEIDSVINQAKSLSEGVEIQVKNLAGLSDTIHQDMNNAEHHIDEKIKLLQQISHQAVEEIDTAASLMNDKISNLHQLQVTSVESAKALCDELSDRHSGLVSSIQETHKQTQQVCGKILEEIETAKTAENSFIDTLKEAEENLSRQAANLQDVSENMDAQNRLNTTSIEQQHKLLVSVLGKIETGKEAIKQQLEDLLRMANTIDDETLNSMKNMEMALNDNLQKSAQIADNASGVTSQLKTQSQALEVVSEQVVAKTIDFAAVIKENQNSMDTLLQNVVGEAERVASVLEAQIKAVNSTTDNTTSKHNRLLELFTQQSSILNNTAENTTKYVADMVQSLDEKAETISTLFKNQQAEFFSICDKLADNTGHMAKTLKDQMSLFEQGSDRVFSRMSGFEEEFSKKAEMLTNTSNQTIAKLSDITDILSHQNEEIDKSVAYISDKMQAVGDDVGKYLTVFKDNLQAVKEESSLANSEISNNCNKLKESQRSLLTDSQNVIQMLENQIKVFENSVTQVQNQSEQISTNLSKQKDSITDVLNLVSTQTRLGEASLAQQYKYLSDAASDINKKMKEIEHSFQSNMDNVLENGGKLAFEINSLSDKLIKASEDVQKTAKQSVGALDTIGISLSNTTDSLVETVNKKIGSVINKYQNNIANFNTVTAEASSGIVEVNNLISQQNDKMIKISEDTKSLVDKFGVVLNEASNQLSKRANTAYEQIQAMGAQMKELGLQLEDSTQLTAKHIDDAGEKMRANINEIAANAERISNDIRSSGEVFLKQSDVLLQATGDTLSKVNEAMNALKSGSDTLTLKGKMWLDQTDEFTKVFERQAEIIDTTSLKANENLRKLERKYQEVQTDSFMKDAAVLFEKMEGLAIDINRIFNPTTEEEVWRKYYAGDTSAFVRYLAKVMTKNQVGAIRKEYEDNADFRTVVNRYVSDFETLISKAKGNERAGVLLSVISGSDVGKVYYIIAKALDKLN